MRPHQGTLGLTVSALSKPATIAASNKGGRSLIELLSNSRSLTQSASSPFRTSLTRLSSKSSKARGSVNEPDFIENATEENEESVMEANAVKIAIVAGSGDCVHHILTAVLDEKVGGVDHVYDESFRF